VLVEKTAALGGATLKSIGLFAAAGTRLQRRRGISDTPQDHRRDMLQAGVKLGGVDNPEIAGLLADHAGSTVGELERLGVVFFGPVPHPEQSHDRLHVVLPNAAAYIHHLARAARRSGVEIMLNAPVKELVTRDGAVTGVALHTAERAMLTARRGIVLASGDFSSDPALKRLYCDPATAEVDGLVSQNTGDGHRFGLALGSQIMNGALVSGPLLRFAAPQRTFLNALPPWSWTSALMRLSLERLPPRIFRPLLMKFTTATLGPEKDLFLHGAILVNRRGERFCDELSGPEFEIPRQPSKSAFIVFDDRLARKFDGWPHFVSTAPGVAYAYMSDYARNRADLYFKAATPAQFAAALGMPPDALEATIARCRSAAPPDRPIFADGPLHALGPLQSWLLVTEGGLCISRQLEVLTRDGTPIPGLYAAGGVGQGGALLASLGNHIGWAMTSGRLAGTYAAARQA
jgi:hypothetical protein